MGALERTVAAGLAAAFATSSGGCSDADAAPPLASALASYEGVTVSAVDPGLFRFEARVGGLAGAGAAEEYARCRAAAYALERGFGYVRHVRTITDKTGGVWRADAVYTMSPDKPGGPSAIDAAAAAAACAEQGIPTA